MEEIKFENENDGIFSFLVYSSLAGLTYEKRVSVGFYYIWNWSVADAERNQFGYDFQRRSRCDPTGNRDYVAGGGRRRGWNVLSCLRSVSSGSS